MNKQMGQHQTHKNLLINILAYGVQFLIALYIAPVIVTKIGTSAYGFFGLANDFVSYASILTTVFNSVAARFIANEYYKKHIDKANSYFNSLIVANFVIAGILAIVGVGLIPFLNQILTIPSGLLFDVQITFALVFGSYIITVLTLVFTTSTFVTNRTDLQGIRNIVGYLVRFGVIVVFLNFISVKLYWVALGALISSIIVGIWNIDLNRLLTPDLSINLKSANKKSTLELAGSGFWMAFTSMSVVLMRGLDLTIANIFLGAHQMGLLSIAREMPNNITNVISTVAPIFTPVFISHYAHRDYRTLIRNVEQSIKTIGLMLFVPITGFIVFASDFYRLWQPALNNSEIRTVTILSTITILQAYFNSSTSTLAQLSVVTNKLRTPVLVSFGSGLLNVLIVIALIHFTGLGIFAIVISSSLVMILRYIFFNGVYASVMLGVNKWTFYSTVIRVWLSIPVLIITMVVVKRFFIVTSWLTFAIAALFCAIVGYLEMIIFFGKGEWKTKLFSRFK